MTLNRRLILGAMILVSTTLLLAALVITYLVNREFDSYISETYMSEIDQIKTYVELIYSKEVTPSLGDVGLLAVSEGFYLDILDESGEVIYASQNIPSGNMMGQNLSLVQRQAMPMFADLQIVSYVIESKGANFLLTIGYEGIDGISEDATRFKSTVYIGIIAALVMSLLVGFALSNIMAKPLSKDIQSAAQAAEAIASGRLATDLESRGTVYEIASLNGAMNRMAQILSEQEDLRRGLVENVSHEVKTPLTVLKSQIEAILDGLYEPDPIRLGKCLEEIVRLEGLINRMSDYDSFTESSFVMNLSQFNLQNELEALKMILTPQFNKKKLTLLINGMLDEEINLDRYKFRQIMFNLLSNAYKFSDEKTEVIVEGQIDKGKLSIVVINSGLVIEKDDYEKVFDSRYRSSKADLKDPHGKGLGLSISRSLATFMSGVLYLESSDSDKTVFVLEITQER